MRLYDAGPIIYAVEAIEPFREAVVARISQAEHAPGGLVITSQLSRLECRVKPLRDGDATLLAAFDAFFARRLLSLIEISADVLDRATELRARYGLRTPDAIHVATAIEARADIFLTGDTSLRRVSDIPVEVLDPL